MHNCETSLLGAEDSRIQIFLISGVPGVGKTTLSYELLKRFSTFRIIQETDLIREILRGYNEYLQERYCDCNHILIPDHTKIFTYEELKEQCTIMKNSIEQIVLRQIRKGIPSILNGVHIVPEILNGIAGNHRIKFINSGNTDELLKEAEAVIKHSKDMNTRIMAQIVVRKHLLYNKKLSFSKKQQLVDRIFGKSARKTLLSPSRTL